MASRKARLYGILVFFISLSLAALPESGMTAETVFESAAAARQDLTLTVYGDNLVLVRDVRKAALADGATRIRFLDVPATLIPESVRVKSLNASGDFSVSEQIYDHNLADPHSLLARYVGKSLKLMRWNEFQDRKEIVDAVLLSSDPEPVYQIGNELYLDYPATKILPALPEGFVLKPSLSWNAVSRGKKIHELEVAYLASGLSWKTDYALVLGESGNAELAAWATLSNQSGTAFDRARLKLVAGQLNRTYAPPPQPMMYARAAMAMDAMEAAPSFKQREAFEYYAFDLSVPVSIGQNQTRQIALFQPRQIKVEKIYRLDSGNSYYYGQPYNPDSEKQPVNVYLRLLNREADGLGLPLPEGLVRIYQKDNPGQMFLGEDSMPNLPKEEKFEARSGTAFDLTARRKQIDYKQVAANTFESEWEVKIKSAKKEDVQVEIIENLAGSWQIISQSHPEEKVSSSAVRFRIKIPKGGETVLRYRVRVGY